MGTPKNKIKNKEKIIIKTVMFLLDL